MRALSVLVLMVLVLGAGTAVHGQPASETRGQAGGEETTLAVSVDALSARLRPSERIYVQTTGGAHIVGRFAAASEVALTVEIDGRLRDVPASEVRLVQRQGGRRIGRGALIGFLVGAGGGLLAATAGGDSSGAALAIIGFGGMGAEIGAVVGIFVRERPVVYRGDPTVSAVVEPVVGAGQIGLTASVRF